MPENTTILNSLYPNESYHGITPYLRQAMYYETDQMGIIHHSNYIRWFEEARIDFLEKVELPYKTIESLGIFIPVLDVSCEYKSPVKFNEKVIVFTEIKSFNGVKMTIHYQILDAASKVLRVTGVTSHCFLNKEFRPIPLKKTYPDIYEKLTYYIA